MTLTIRNPWRYVANFCYLPELPRVFLFSTMCACFLRVCAWGEGLSVLTLSKIILTIRTAAQRNWKQLSLITKKSFHLPFNYLFKMFKNKTKQNNFVRKGLVISVALNPEGLGRILWLLRLVLIKTLTVFNCYKCLFDFLMSNLVLYIQVNVPKLLTLWLKIGFESVSIKGM